MNLNEIKIGAKLACDAKIAEIDGDVVYIEFSAHKKFRLAAELVELLDAQNAAPSPKYDPCRLFRDGDKVTPRLVNGRDFNSIAEDYRGKILTVTRDEEKYDNVYVEYGGDEFTIDPAYLELVTPVEELEPYSIDECGFANVVYLRKNGKTYMTIPYAHPVCLFKTEAEALAAAVVERDRLNAEYGKEQK